MCQDEEAKAMKAELAAAKTVAEVVEVAETYKWVMADLWEFRQRPTEAMLKLGDAIEEKFDRVCGLT